MENNYKTIYINKKIDDNIFNLLKNIDPFVKYENIKNIKWINEYDLYVKFTNGKKYLIDSTDGSYKYLTYSIFSISDNLHRKWIRN